LVCGLKLRLVFEQKAKSAIKIDQRLHLKLFAARYFSYKKEWDLFVAEAGII
jgi:hypothetical protein